MFGYSSDINEEADLHQRRVLLEDPTDPDTRAISNIIIYASFYYPHSKSFLLKVLLKLKDKHITRVEAAITHLYQCIERQVISGPSSSYLPPSELPSLHHQDSQLLLQSKSNNVSIEQLTASIQNLGLSDVFEKDDLPELAWYNCSRFLSLSNVQQYHEGYKVYQSELELDGESWLQTTPFPSLFCTLSFILEHLLQDALPTELQASLRLLWARLSFLHNKNLKHPVKRLSDIILTSYKRVFSIKRTYMAQQNYVEFLLQYSFALLFYYKYTQAESILRHCSQVLQMKLEFTGKLGRRTKYQQFDTPQLVMTITNSEQGNNEQDKNEEYLQQGSQIQFMNAKQLVAQQKERLKSSQESTIKTSIYNQESILLETPHFVQEPEVVVVKEKKITEHHLLLTLATLYYEWRSAPHEEMQYQNISASVMTLLKFNVPTSFSYNFSLLLLRSLNEFPRFKHTERALDQFEKLRLGFNHKVNKSIYNLYSTPYETHLSYVLVLADKYMEMGMSLTAIQLFEQAGLFQECVDVLIQKSYKEKALELINRLIEENGKNPRILCMLGDIHKDNVKYYQQAWELSKHHNARSMRSLGWIYFNKKDFVKAAECFHNATQASYYHPNTWFTLGCCYMNDKQFDKAIRSFGQCVSIDDSQGEAWGNIASCYMHQKKMKEAFSSLEQAVKFSQGNWMLWANMITVSLTVKKFFKYFDAIERIAKLGRQQVLTEGVFQKIVQVMCFKNESTERRRIIFNFRNRINRLYEYLEKFIGQNPLVWRSRSEYEIQILVYIEIMSSHYNKLHSTNTLDPNDIIPGYETPQSTILTTQTQVAQTKGSIVAHKQCELNMTMRVGWHDNKTVCERVKQVLLQYIEIYRKYSDRQDKNDFKLFVTGIWQKISHCLELNEPVSLEWLQ